MSILSFFSRKRTSGDLSESSTDQEASITSSQTPEHYQEPQRKKQHITASEKKKAYKGKLSFRKEWEKKYPWVTCKDPGDGMFCSVCQKWGKPPAGSRGAWTSKGVVDWNHATELLKQHADSQWHRDSAVVAAMAQQSEGGNSVLQLQCSAAAREAAERRQRNRCVLLKLLRSTYFLIQNKIPHTTVYPHLVQLQVANGDQLLEQHINEGPSNAQYTSKFSVVSMLDAIDTWLERKLVQSLKLSPFFSIMADECQDISTQEELSICCRWLINGCPEEHFLTILHVKSTDAEEITHALTTYISEKELEYTKLVGQGYDGAATFCGIRTGVQRRMRLHHAHALYIHCSCHRLQLASIQAAESSGTVKKMFGTMVNLWKIFYYSAKKAEALKEVQAVLNIPDLKVVKPSDTRWLSHERCVRAISKELPALIITLHNLYECSGDAEAYGLAIVLSSFTGVATIFLLRSVLDLLAKLNCYVQRKSADFSKLPIILESIVSEIKELKNEDAEWCSQVATTVDMLTSKYDITLMTGSTQSSDRSVTTLNEFCNSVAAPYIDALVANINDRFSDGAVKLLVSSSIFNPSLFPTDEMALPDYGNKELQVLLDFYGKEATVDFDGVSHTSPPLVDGEEVLAEWRVFKRALVKEKRQLWRK